MQYRSSQELIETVDPSFECCFLRCQNRISDAKMRRLPNASEH